MGVNWVQITVFYLLSPVQTIHLYRYQGFFFYDFVVNWFRVISCLNAVRSEVNVCLEANTVEALNWRGDREGPVFSFLPCVWGLHHQICQLKFSELSENPLILFGKSGSWRNTHLSTKNVALKLGLINITNRKWRSILKAFCCRHSIAGNNPPFFSQEQRTNSMSEIFQCLLICDSIYSKHPRKKYKTGFNCVLIQHKTLVWSNSESITVQRLLEGNWESEVPCKVPCKAQKLRCELRCVLCWASLPGLSR